MPTQTVIVAYVNAPREGKKNGSIKTKGGDYYGVPPAMLSQFEQGGTYQVEYSTREFQGQTYRNVVSVQKQAPAPSTNGASAGAGAGGFREVSPAVQLNMAIHSWVEAGISSGQVQFSDEAIGDAIRTVIKGYRDGTAALSQKSNDMNDEIPF